jgi:hypothetical protein
MRQNKINPNHTRTRLFSEVEKALKVGIREVIISLPWEGGRRKKLAAMHILGDRVLFFHPDLNPEMSYGADLGTPGDIIDDGINPAFRYEGNGMHSVSKALVKELFYDAKAFALIPKAFKLVA